MINVYDCIDEEEHKHEVDNDVQRILDHWTDARIRAAQPKKERIRETS